MGFQYLTLHVSPFQILIGLFLVKRQCGKNAKVRKRSEKYQRNLATLHMSGPPSASSSYILTSVRRLQAAVNKMQLLRSALHNTASVCLCEC